MHEARCPRGECSNRVARIAQKYLIGDDLNVLLLLRCGMHRADGSHKDVCIVQLVESAVELVHRTSDSNHAIVNIIVGFAGRGLLRHAKRTPCKQRKQQSSETKIAHGLSSWTTKNILARRQ